MKIAPEVERKTGYGLVVNTRRGTMKIVMAGIAFLGLVAISGLVPVHAQQAEPNCAPLRDLVTIPAIEHQNGRLRGVVMLADEDRALAGATSCDWQHLRYFKGYSLLTENPVPWPLDGGMLPGPTLRARIGDLVQIAFLNQINIANFPISLDQAERGNTEGCDIATASRKHPNRPRGDGTTPRTVEIYPKNSDGTDGDSMPNCLHGSSTANIHFHGTHTTPSTTGDNVLLFVRPALRNAAGEITGPIEEEVMKQIKEVWDRCERDGSPKQWSDLPEAWRSDQKALLERYDSTAPYKGVNGALPEEMKLWPRNQSNLDNGVWPQYSLGAFPYCYRLPDFADGNVRMGQAPGTHWYHAHKHGSTALNVGNGMSGAFIIEGPYDDALKEFYKETGLKEHVLVIQQLETTLNLQSAGTGKTPPPFSVNGRVNPVVTMRPGEVQMWRIVNAAARTFVQFDHFDSHGPGRFSVEWRQIAQDGVQFSYENYQRVGTINRKFNLAAANRADLLVKAPMHESDYALNIVASVSDDPTGTPLTLLTVRVRSDGENTPMDFIQLREDFPKLPPYLADIRGRAYTKRELVYNTDPSPGRRGEGKMPQHKINDEQFNEEVISQQMTLNTVEEWKMVNETVGIAHPFHIHINPFQIVEVFQPDKNTECVDPTDPDTWKPCKKLTPPFVWWDTFAIPSAKEQLLDPGVCITLEDCPAAIQDYTTCTERTPTAQSQCTVKIPGYFKMRTFFADFTGEYVNHCHILAHEDRGMMQLIEVIPRAKNIFRHR